MKLIVFDMDGTLLDGRTILYLAKEFGFYDEAIKLIESDRPKSEISRMLAHFLKGINIHDFMRVIHGIPLMNGALETVEAFKKQGYKTAIITDSYDIVAKYFKELLGIDREIGIKLTVEDEMITGKIEMPLNCPDEGSCDYPSMCKMEIMKGLGRDFGIPSSEIVAIGDNRVDLCMIKEAGVGIAFKPKVEELAESADVVIREKDLRQVLPYINVNISVK
jgi:phosphoserine phosphatase